MKTIGIFEAKTRLPSLCKEVAESGSPILIQRRGHPLVVVSPVPADIGQLREDIYQAWKAWDVEFGEEETSDFPEVWKIRHDRASSPLNERS